MIKKKWKIIIAIIPIQKITCPDSIEFQRNGQQNYLIICKQMKYRIEIE